jgi:hypothetical protein
MMTDKSPFNDYKRIDFISVNNLQMAFMIVGFIVSICLVNLAIYWLVTQYQIELFLYWNISNIIYGILNVLLLFIINF